MGMSPSNIPFIVSSVISPPSLPTDIIETPEILLLAVIFPTPPTLVMRAS
jgi:hypothetical protein